RARLPRAGTGGPGPADRPASGAHPGLQRYHHVPSRPVRRAQGWPVRAGHPAAGPWPAELADATADHPAIVKLDLIIRGGRIVDGSPAAKPRPADVGVRDEQIVAIGNLAQAVAPIVISAADRVIAPGFIDPHVHSETALRGNPDRYGALLQGATTHLTGADGFGWAGLPG